MDNKKIHIGYMITPVDAENYELSAKFYNDNQVLLKEVNKNVSMKEFNSLLVYSEEDHLIKSKAEEIVKTAMYNAMAKLLEQDIKIASALLELKTK